MIAKVPIAYAALRRTLRTLSLALLAVGANVTVGAATVTVQVAPQGSFAFSPNPVFVQPGDTVRWAWKSNTMPHTVTSGASGIPDGLFDSGSHQSTTFIFSQTFATPGKFPYFCEFHKGVGMRGTVVVGAAPSNLSNISTRAFAQLGDNVLIGGFIITGSGNKPVLVRALGPTLSNFGINNALPNPLLELYDSTGAVVDSNDDWHSAATFNSIPANLRPPNSLESAIWASLAAGSYTAIVRGVNNTIGTVLLEIYDLDTAAGPMLRNVSSRGLVQTSNDVMIGGFIIQGSTTENVLARALGPTLTNFGLTGALADPTLELRDANGNLVDSNDNWKSTNQAAIMATGLQPPNDLESAILRALNAGSYTAIVRGVNTTTGIALVEIYALQ